MKIDRDNIKTFKWPESSLSYDESVKITSAINQLNIDLFEGKIKAEEYNELSSKLMQRIDSNSLEFGKDFELFRHFLLRIYKDKERAIQSANHEKEHADFLVKKGIEDFSFKIKLFDDERVQPFTHFVNKVNTRILTENSFKLHKDFLTAPANMSDSDKSSAQKWSTLGISSSLKIQN